MKIVKEQMKDLRMGVPSFPAEEIWSKINHV
jgi:hypothetical protein